MVVEGRQRKLRRQSVMRLTLFARIYNAMRKDRQCHSCTSSALTVILRTVNREPHVCAHDTKNISLTFGSDVISQRILGIASATKETRKKLSNTSSNKSNHCTSHVDSREFQIEPGSLLNYPPLSHNCALSHRSIALCLYFWPEEIG